MTEIESGERPRETRDVREALQGRRNEEREKVRRRHLTVLDTDGISPPIIEILLNVDMDRAILLEGEGGLEALRTHILLEEDIKADLRNLITVTIQPKEVLQTHNLAQPLCLQRPLQQTTPLPILPFLLVRRHGVVLNSTDRVTVPLTNKTVHISKTIGPTFP